MQTTFNSLFEIYPDKLRKGAVVGYRKADGTPLEFPCTIDTGDAVRDAKGRWIASALGLKPVVAKYLSSLKRARVKEAWIGNGFCQDTTDDKWYVNNSTLERVRFADRVTSIGEEAFLGCIALTSVTIPSSVTSIGWHAFDDCTGLTSVTIPSSVTSIGCYAFVHCTALTSVEIPDSVTEIGEGAFCGCTALTEINVAEGNANYTSVDGVLFSKDKRTLVKYPERKSGVYSIPNGVTEIGESAFGDCSTLASITIPESVTEIGEWAFSGCISLTSVTIPSSVTSIGYFALDGCTGLKSITIPDSVTEIGDYTFRDCNSLTDVYVDQLESDLLDKADLPSGCTVHWNQAEAV